MPRFCVYSAIAGAIGMALFVPSPVLCEDQPAKSQTSSEVLDRYRQDLLKVFVTFPGEKDTKSRQLLIQTAKKQFESDVKTCEKSKDAIGDQYARYLSNVTLARTGFANVAEKYKDGAQVKQAYAMAASKVFLEDVTSAADYSQKNDHCAWFRECVGMLKKAQLLGQGEGADKDAGQAYSLVQKLYSAVLKENEGDAGQNAVENLKANMVYLRSQFPTNTDELKKTNGRIATMLEAMAQQQFKLESGKK